MTISQNNAPYFDDANNAIDSDYAQILFKPNFAVQARELTQLQSILQNQIENLGDFLFQNGSPVSGGHITFDNSVYGIFIQSNDSISLSDFQGKLIINPTGAVDTIAVVIAIDSTVASNTVEGALIVKYLSGNEFQNGDSLQISTGSPEVATLLSSNAVYRASIASLNEGYFYCDGYFVYVPQQTVVLSSSSPTPNAIVGLQINTAIVTSATDSSLLDPAQGSFNYQAPGADRFQFSLDLATRALNSTDLSQFFQLLTVQNGVITNQVEYPVLGKIEDSLAATTYDINGNFTINPFIVTALDDVTNADAFILSISPGKAYVYGYDFETLTPIKISETKAQTTNTSNDYFLSLAYGNYLTVSNVNSGNVTGFNTGNFGSLDLHIVPSANVNTTNSQAYTNTHVGTALVRDIEYSGVNTWLAYVLDASLPPIVVNAAGVSANTTSVSLPPTFTGSANAIANVSMTVLAGNSAGDTRTIVSYNATSKIGYLDRPTTQLLDTTSQLSIQFGIKDVNSLVATPAIGGNAFATQNADAGLYACMDISVNGGKDQVGNTVLFDSNHNTLAFLLPQAFVAQDSASSVSFMARKTLTTVDFTSGNTTIGTGSGLSSDEVFIFGITGGYIADALAQANFLVVVRDSQTSNLANGQVITWDYGSNPAGNGVYQTDSTHVTIKTVTTGNFIADILVTVEDQDASVNFRRSKTLTGNTANTTLQPNDGYLNGTAVIGTPNSSSDYLDTANGYIWFTNWNDIETTPGVPQSLYMPDVVSIIKIFTSGDPNYAPNATNAIDITANYLFDSGQRDNYYDHASITLQQGANPPSGQTVVIVQYYAEDNTSGYFSCDSYDATIYEAGLIPIYTSAKLGTINLRDVIDFRPTRSIGSVANVQSFTLNGLRLPQPDDAMTISYAFYLGRYDKLVLTKDRQFNILYGVPSVNPQMPADQPNSMTLYTLGIPPYTYHAANVVLGYQENKRYTMADIGGLDNRIAQLEYYATLSQLEQSAANTTVLYQDGTTAKEQYGIITDAFIDFSVADINNPDLFCSINGGVLAPFQLTTCVQFELTSNTGPFGENGETYTLAFTETPAIVQNTASDYTQIQPYAFGQFQGQVKLSPSSDVFYSQNLNPTIVGVGDVPPLYVTPVVVPPSNVGLNSPVGTNPANLKPATTTANTAPIPAPKVGVVAPAAPAPAPVIYRIPIYGWRHGYGDESEFYDIAYELGGSYFNNQYFYGTTEIEIEKTATGWKLLIAGGNWVPITAAEATVLLDRTAFVPL